MQASFQPHPPGMQHPGMPHGQPMGMMQPTPGQHLGHGIPPQMHMGMGGPNGPHVGQGGPMMGMHSGIPGRPNMHGMPNLQPGPMYGQHPQMGQTMNPQAFNSHQQQVLRQRQQMLQAQQSGGMMIGMQPLGTGMSPAQFQQLQQNQQLRQGMNLPANMQAQFEAQQRQQVQQAQAQAAAHAQAQAQARAQAQAQAQQNPALMQHMAMQHATSQASHHSQNGQPQAQAMRLQPSMQGGHDPQNTGHPPPQQPPQSQGTPRPPEHQQPPQRPPTQPPPPQQQPSQPQPPQASHNQGQQSQGQISSHQQQALHSNHQTPQIQHQPAPPQPQPTPQSQPKPPPQQPPNNQQQQASQQTQQPAQGQQTQAQQGQGPTQLQAQAQAQQQQLQQQQQQQQMAEQQQLRMRQMAIGPQAALLRQQQLQGAQSNAMSRLMQFCDRLGGFSTNSKANEMPMWQNFVADYFADDAIYKTQLWDRSDQNYSHEISMPVLARYFWTQFNSGVERMQITISSPQQRELPNGCFYVESQRSTFTYWYELGSQVVWTGSLKAMIGPTSKMTWFEFFDAKHEEYLKRSDIEKLFSPDSPNNMKTSPKATKQASKAKAGKGSQAQQTPTISMSELPTSPVGAMGVTQPLQEFLENVNVFSYMRDLFEYAHQNNNLTPKEALEGLVAQLQTQQQNPLMNQQQMSNMTAPNPAVLALQQQQQQFQQPPPGMRTPGVNDAGPPNANVFASPAHVNLNLPNANNTASPRIPPSPAQPGQMGAPAPPMIAQRSQQGSSSNASATASPNVSNKRRRTSIKVESGNIEDPSNTEVNGVGAAGQPKVKPSLKVNAKRQKANTNPA